MSGNTISYLSLAWSLRNWVILDYEEPNGLMVRPWAPFFFSFSFGAQVSIRSRECLSLLRTHHPRLNSRISFHSSFLVEPGLDGDGCERMKGSAGSIVLQGRPAVNLSFSFRTPSTSSTGKWNNRGKLIRLFHSRCLRLIGDRLSNQPCLFSSWVRSPSFSLRRRPQEKETVTSPPPHGLDCKLRM